MSFEKSKISSVNFAGNVKFSQRENFTRQFFSLAPLLQGTVPAQKTERSGKTHLAYFNIVMRFTLENIKNSPTNVLRRLGYRLDRRKEETGELGFIRRVGMDEYPRFHVFTKQTEFGKVEISMHIDQKKASYEGTAAHSGEYENEGWLAKEAEAIKEAFMQK